MSIIVNGQVTFDNGTPRAKEELTEKSDTFNDVTRLCLAEIPGRVEIVNSHSSATHISIKGLKSLVEGIKWTKTGNMLDVRCSKEAGGHITINNGDIVIGNGGSITAIDIKNCSGLSLNNGSVTIGSIGDANVVTTDSDAGNALQTRIEIPSGIDICYENNTKAELSIDDVECNLLDVDLGGSNTVRAGAVRNLKVESNGSSEVEVDRLLGGLSELELTGSGRVCVKDGMISDLVVKLTGSARVAIGAIAQTAKLELTGSGNIRIKKPITILERRVTGTGKIDIYD